jgi:hypothetical protein
MQWCPKLLKLQPMAKILQHVNVFNLQYYLHDTLQYLALWMLEIDIWSEELFYIFHMRL